MVKIKDEEAVGQLKSFIGDSFIELVETYVRTSSKYVSSIVEGMKSGDAQQIIDAAHPLKSSAGNLGLMKLHIMCRDLEEIANDVLAGEADFSAIKERGEGIQALNEQSNEALKAEL